MSRQKRPRAEDDAGEGPSGTAHEVMGDQSRRERQEIRHTYRGIQNELEQHRHSLVEGDDEKLNELLKKSADTFRQVKRTHEAAIDAQVFASLSKIGAERALKMSTDFVNFDANVFVAKLKARFGIGGDDGRLLTQAEADDEDGARGEDAAAAWAKMGRFALPVYRTLPAVNFVFGPLDIVAVKRKAAERAKKPVFDPSQKVTPLEGLAPGASSEETTTGEVKVVLEHLRKQRGPINVFRFVINPESFSQTVENIFHLSFLVKDGQARILLKDGIPFVEAVEQDEEGDAQPQERKQAIFEMTVPIWKEIIEALSITDSIIPHRHVTSDGQAYASTQHAGAASSQDGEDGAARAPKKRRK